MSECTPFPPFLARSSLPCPSKPWTPWSPVSSGLKCKLGVTGPSPPFLVAEDTKQTLRKTLAHGCAQSKGVDDLCCSHTAESYSALKKNGANPARHNRRNHGNAVVTDTKPTWCVLHCQDTTRTANPHCRDQGRGPCLHFIWGWGA
jgi:hypothetical protein